MFSHSEGRRTAVTRSDILSEFERVASESDISQASSPWLLGQAEALIRIERCVNWILRSPQPAYLLDWRTPGRPVVTEMHIGRRLRDVLSLSDRFSSGYQYSEQVAAFLHACFLMRNVYGVDYAQLPLPPAPIGPREAELLNDVVARIRMSASEPWYTRTPIDRSYESRQRARVVAEYTASILRYFARTLVVRLDLSYLESGRRWLTIDQVYAHLDQLRYLIDVHPMFESLVGYVWSIEQGERDGYHLHCIFFFDGSKVCRDVYKGFEIGKLWQMVITGGTGHFENCNAHKERYTRLGIGMIHRDNAEQCLAAIEVLQYIAKDDGQHLRIKPHGRRIFGTGQAPDITCKRGRPAADATWMHP